MNLTLEEIKNNGQYISEVSATEEDVKSGRAIFHTDGKTNPIKIKIPQYAWHIDSETRERTLWIIIQAEENLNPGVRVFGAIDPKTGGSMAGLESEFELIGDTLPTN